MSFSKIKDKKSVIVALDKTDKHKIYYHTTSGVRTLISPEGKFEPYHHGDQLIYIVGRRGCGKSTYCNMYLHNYIKATKNRVFLISRLEEDPSIELPERGMRVPLDEIENIDMEDFANSLVIFDDIEDSRLTKEQHATILGLVKDIMENSRHFNISALITSHIATNYARTRTILNECSAVVVFPQYSNRYQIERMLKTYFGLKQSEINELFLRNTRWIQLTTLQPKYILTAHEITLY